MPAIVDTHCHLDFTVFDNDRAQVIEQSQQRGVNHFVVPAVSQQTWQQTIDVCHEFPPLHLALGLHPLFIEQHQPQHLNQLDSLVSKYKPIAIGEIGLDFYQKHNKESTQSTQELHQEKQRLFFSKQLIIAKQHALPVIIHNRKAHDECIKTLYDIEVVGGIIHNFSGSIQHAHKYIDMGFKLGFGGMLTYERSRVIRNLAKQIPLSAIVLETDAPDLTVATHTGQRNSPEYLPDILCALAQIKEKSEEHVATITTQNAITILGLQSPT